MNFWTYNILKHNEINIKCDTPVNQPGFWREILRYFKKWVKEDIFNYTPKEVHLEDIVFITTTKNNERALEPIWDKCDMHQVSIIKRVNEKDILYYRWREVAGYSFLYLYPLVNAYRRATEWEKKIMRSEFLAFFMVMGAMAVTRKLLRKNHIHMVVMANDHNPIERSWIAQSQKYGVKTMYLQHCSVTEKFPSLQFTYAFLDGEESLEKYLHIGDTKGMIYVSGTPRFDRIHEYYENKVKDSTKLGLAINEEDNEKLVMDLCERLQSAGIEKIVLRPHPRQDLREKQWYKEHNIEISDSKIDSPFEFLGRIKMLVASESGIHLDAAMMGVYSVCYSMTGRKAIDWYSYIKNGLIPNAETDEELMELLRPEHITTPEKLHEKAQWYNAAYGRPVEGHVGEMLADFIRYEQNDAIDKFDKKYGFVTKEQTEHYTIKVYEN